MRRDLAKNINRLHGRLRYWERKVMLLEEEMRIEVMTPEAKEKEEWARYISWNPRSLSWRAIPPAMRKILETELTRLRDTGATTEEIVSSQMQVAGDYRLHVPSWLVKRGVLELCD